MPYCSRYFLPTLAGEIVPGRKLVCSLLILKSLLFTDPLSLCSSSLGALRNPCDGDDWTELSSTTLPRGKLIFSVAKKIFVYA